MLSNLLGFFEGTGTGTGGDTTGNTGGGWVTWVVFGVLIVGMIVMMVIPQRKQKKRQQEMMSTLALGSIVTTIGGIIGEVVAMDEKHIWLVTGLDDDKHVVQFLRQAIHSIAPAPGSEEAIAEAKAEKEKAEEVDEIK